MGNIRKIIDRIWDEVGAQAGMLSGMSVLLILIETIVYLMQADRSRFDLCILDPFAIVSYTSGITLVPLGALTGVFLLREEFQAMRVVRMKKVSYIWLDACVKNVAAAAVISAAGTLCCGILGKITASAAYTWSGTSSIFFFLTGRTLPVVSYGKVCLMFFTGIFFAVWASGMIVLLGYWLSGTYLWGMTAILIFCVLGTLYHFPYDLYRGVNYYIVSETFTWKYQVVLPAAVVMCCVGTGFLVQRRDFLMKERQAE